MIENETGLFFIDPSEVEMIPIGELKVYKKNAKKHTPEQIEQIINSIKAFGMNDPIAVWSKANIIVEGHGRYMALRQMGETGEVPCIRLDHLTDEQRRAYALAHNKLTMNTDFDMDILASEFEDLADFFEMADFGFDTFGDEEDDPAEVVEDEAPELDEVEPVCKRGQVWVLGNHRLMCGDSTDADDVARLMNGEKADMAFTSPPYNAGKSARLTGNTHMTECKYENGDDNLTDYDKLLIGATDNMLMFSKWAFINLQMLANNKVIICEWLNNYKDFLCDIAIWYKNATAPAMAERVMNSQFEFIFIFGNDNNSRAVGTKTFRGTVSNVYQGSAQRKNEYAGIHSATFPVEFVSHFVSNFTGTNDVVLDVFGGTGTTLIACEQLDRRCFMMELDPHYCDVIIKRWENLTGQTAVLAEE